MLLIEIPDIDSFNPMISLLELLSDDSDYDISSEFTEDQINHYLEIADYMGLVNLDFGDRELTPYGKEVVALDAENRRVEFNNYLVDNNFIKIIFEQIEKSDGVNFSELREFVIKNGFDSGSILQLSNRLVSILHWATEIHYLSIVYPPVGKDSEPLYFYNYNTLEIEDTKDDRRGSIYPADYNGEELDIKDDHISVFALMRKKEQGKILIPEFQRHQVWKKQQKSRFIESLILNIPVPPFYVSQDLEGRLIIIDGLQRSTAIDEFINDKFELAALEALPELNGNKFSQLENNLRARIEDRGLLLYTLKPSVPLSIVYDIFNRINSNGTALTRQEIRNCIFIGPATRFLKELSEDKVFKESIDYGIPWKRMKDREAILRFLAFTMFDFNTDYKGDMDSFLGKTMRRINNMKEAEINLLRERFIRIMKLTYGVFGKANFRLPTSNSRGRVNIAIFESVCYFFNSHTDEYIKEFSSNIRKGFDDLLKDQAYRDAVRLSTSSDKNVKLRFRKTIEYLEFI